MVGQGIGGGKTVGCIDDNVCTVAQVLLAQRDLLELRVNLIHSQAAHARAWAGLEAQCGSLQRNSAQDQP